MAWARRLGTAHRWVVLVLATAVWARCFGEARLEEFGWQFRHLEIWALTASLLSAAMTLSLSMGWSRERHDAFVASVAAANAVVVAGHLGLRPGGAAYSAPMAAYLFLLGPLLQIADATLILRAFHRLRGAVAGALSFAVAYVLWVELAVRPLNASPDGAGGLPYAALDAMEPSARLAVYAAGTTLALAAVPGLWALQRATCRAPGRAAG